MKNPHPQYYIAYERDRESGGYVASAPAIPGCAVYGKTLREAYHNIRDAICECLEVLREARRTLPQETIRPEVVRKFSFVMSPRYAKTQAAPV